MLQGLSISKLPQTEQVETFSPTELRAEESGNRRVLGWWSKNKTNRLADRFPMPGRRSKRAIKSSMSMSFPDF